MAAAWTQQDTPHEGLHPMALEKEIAVGTDKFLIKEYLLTKNKEIESMEWTKLAEDNGCWLFVCKKKDMNEVSAFLDKELQQLYQQAVPSELQFDGMPTSQCKNHYANQAMGSYVETLTGFSNPQD
eukprot:10661775-Ditylum_brightwellii.AAC.1